MTNAELQELLRQRDEQIKELKKEIRELKKLLVEKAKAKDAKLPKEASNYSVARHEQKQRKRRHKNSTGRQPKDAKRDRVAETFELYWHGANRKKCEYGIEILITLAYWVYWTACRSTRRAGFCASSRASNFPSRKPIRCFRN